MSESVLKPRKNVRLRMLMNRGYSKEILSRIGQDDILNFTSRHSNSYHCKIKTIASYASIMVRDGVYQCGVQHSITTLFHQFGDDQFESSVTMDDHVRKWIKALGIPLYYEDGMFHGDDTDWIIAFTDHQFDPILRGLNLEKLRSDIADINDYDIKIDYGQNGNGYEQP